MYRVVTYGLLIFICFTDCVSPFDYQPETTGRFLVVNGGINQLDPVNRIRLMLSTPYSSNSNARPIENGEIILVNSKNEQEPFYAEGDGWYAHYGMEVQINAGEAYHIEIYYLDKFFKSEDQIVPVAIVPDSVSHNAGYKDVLNTSGSLVTIESIDIFINTPINVNDQTSYIRWKVDESWSFVERSCGPMHIPKVCYVNETVNPDQIYIYSSEKNSGIYLPNHLVAEKNNPRPVEFTTKHFVNVHQLTINKATYEYWQKVVQLANPDGDIFDLPPAPLRGNVYNVNNKDEVVLGYFEAAGKATLRKVLYKSDIQPIRVPNKEYLCSYWGGYHIECCYCLELENSTLIRPDYWD